MTTSDCSSPPKCLACGARSFRKWGKQNGFHVMQCQQCFMGYTWPVPTDVELRAANADIYTIENRIAAYRRDEAGFVARYAAALERIAKFKPSGRLLDVGCSLGFFVKAAASAGYAAEGIELNADCAEYALRQTGVPVRCGTLSAAAYPDHSFEVVTLYDVLEHVKDPFALLDEIFRVLKPDGLLVLQMPNIRSLMAGIARNDWSWLCLPDHVHHHSPESIRLITDRCGFAIGGQLTWEPAADFAATLLSKAARHSRIPLALERRTQITKRLVRGLQRLWWLTGSGGLVETFAIRRGTRGDT